MVNTPRVKMQRVKRQNRRKVANRQRAREAIKKDPLFAFVGAHADNTTPVGRFFSSGLFDPHIFPWIKEMMREVNRQPTVIYNFALYPRSDSPPRGTTNWTPQDTSQ